MQPGTRTRAWVAGGLVVALLAAIGMYLAARSGAPDARPPAPSGSPSTATSPGATGSASTSASPSPPPEGRPALWAAVNEGGPGRQQRDALADARNFDLLTALPGAYVGQVDAMRAVNPRLRILAYMNGTFAQQTEGSKHPADWYSRDATDAQITSNGFGNFLMDPRHPGWVADRVSRCQDLISRTGFDGCMVDVVGPAPTRRSYVSGLPIDRTTGRPWQEDDWIAATTALTRRITDAVAPSLVVGNGLDSGQSFYSGPRTDTLLKGMGGGIAEGWLRRPVEPLDRRRSEEAWRRDVDMLVEGTARGKNVLVLLKVWVEGSEEDKTRWRDFGLASYLLGATERTYFGFSRGRTEDPAVAEAALAVEVGAAKGPYAVRGGAYIREFANAVAVVNPGVRPVTVDLGAELTAADGQRVRRLTLQPWTGSVLRR